MIQVLCDRISHAGEDLEEILLRAAPDLEGVVNWTGRRFAPADCTAPILNGESRTDKLAQLTRLSLRGVNVPGFCLTPQPGTLPRTIHHQQGRDFTRPPRVPDFWVERLYLEDEWRLHFFKTRRGNLKLLRSGLKLPKTLRAHPWVKSHRLGWKISYLGGAPPSLVQEARKAMAALKLDFGAVDCALTFGGVPVVLEVNTCPGLEAPTLELYVREILERLG